MDEKFLGGELNRALSTCKHCTLRIQDSWSPLLPTWPESLVRHQFSAPPDLTSIHVAHPEHPHVQKLSAEDSSSMHALSAQGKASTALALWWWEAASHVFLFSWTSPGHWRTERSREQTGLITPEKDQTAHRYLTAPSPTWSSPIRDGQIGRGQGERIRSLADPWDGRVRRLHLTRDKGTTPQPNSGIPALPNLSSH